MKLICLTILHLDYVSFTVGTSCTIFGIIQSTLIMILLTEIFQHFIKQRHVFCLFFVYIKLFKFKNQRALMSTLRECCKERLKVAFDSVRAVSNTLTFILIVDNYGLKVLSNAIKTMELINYGISVVQRLELKRKKISKMEAVYLVSPNSIEKVLEDFPQGGDPQYKSVHVLTLSKIQNEVLQSMGENLNFAKRVKTLKQINFNFSLHSHNEVRLCAYDEKSFNKSLEKNSSLLESTIDELATIVTSMPSFYIVQVYYQKSHFAQKVAFGLKERFERLFKLYEKQSIENYNNSAPVTTFLVLERSFDGVSPLVRDFHYLPLFYDLKDIKNHKISNVGSEKKTLTLNENDEVMEKYKHSHFSSVLKGISNDFTAFSQSHAAVKFQKQKESEDVNMKQVGEALKKLPEYIELKDRYELHYEVLEGLLQLIESKQLKNQGFVEQSLLSLTNEEGKKVKQKDILSNLISTLQKTQSPEERAKLVLIGLMCLELKPKDQSSLADFLNKTPYKGIQKNISKICGPQTYRLNPNKQSKNNQILDRHLPRIAQTVREMSNQSYGDLKHLRVGAAQKSSKPAQKNQNSLGLKKIKFQNQKKDRPKMIVFMNSALGYNQMRCLSEMQNTYHMIYTSHNFVTQSQYVKLINGLSLQQEQEL